MSSGAALGASIALVLGATFHALSGAPLPVFAFAGALGVSALVYSLSRRGGRTPVGLLLLTGIVMFTGVLIS